MGLGRNESSFDNEAALMNVLTVMLADEKITPEEEEFALEMTKSLGLPEERLSYLLKNPQEIGFVIAEAKEERFKQLLDAVQMMIIDGDIDQREMDVCMIIATRLGFLPTIVYKFAETFTDRIQQGEDRDQIKAELLHLFQQGAFTQVVK